MKLHRLRVSNFRNFQCVDVSLDGNVVLIGENRVGKSNLLHAIRLVLDPTLPDSARHLRLSDFWDGCDHTSSPSPQIEVHIEFSDFSNSSEEIALLTDYRCPDNHEVARLSYIYRKKYDIGAPLQSEDECEFIVFGGANENMVIKNSLRRRIGLDMLGALRDAESQLSSWRNSPLRPLIENSTATIPTDRITDITENLEEVTYLLEELDEVKHLQELLRSGIFDLTGPAQDIDARLRFLSSDANRLFRSISMFIDGGTRSISEASLGSANVALIALKLAEFSLKRSKNERTYSLLCIEEPEAHLHPQLQRSVFDKIIKDKRHDQSVIATSHSPTLAAIAPLRTIVHLRASGNQTTAYSMAELPVTQGDMEDIERYLDATRSEILFSRGVIFVEGKAEEVLVPAFAEAMSKNLDRLGISVCNIGGVHFDPYVKLAAALKIRFSVVTDWDPLDGTKPALGRKRMMGIWDACSEVSVQFGKLTSAQRTNLENLGDEEFRSSFLRSGIFSNDSTFEDSVAKTAGLQEVLLDVLSEQKFGPVRSDRIESWRAGKPVNTEQLLSMISSVGKGRLSAKLSHRITQGISPPPYVVAAINHVANHVEPPQASASTSGS